MSAPQTIRQHLMCVQAIADRVDQDWIPSRSSEALVLELRAIADGALAILAAEEDRLRSIIDYLECPVDPPCVKSASGGYCDECAVRWDVEATLASLIPDPLPVDATAREPAGDT